MLVSPWHEGVWTLVRGKGSQATPTIYSLLEPPPPKQFSAVAKLPSASLLLALGCCSDPRPIRGTLHQTDKTVIVPARRSVTAARDTVRSGSINTTGVPPPGQLQVPATVGDRRPELCWGRVYSALICSMDTSINQP